VQARAVWIHLGLEQRLEHLHGLREHVLPAVELCETLHGRRVVRHELEHAAVGRLGALHVRDVPIVDACELEEDPPQLVDLAAELGEADEGLGSAAVVLVGERELRELLQRAELLG
jgi:hypothetical protein